MGLDQILQIPIGRIQWSVWHCQLGSELKDSRAMKSKRSSRYSGYRFPAEIISYAIWAYYRFCLSFRDVEDLLAERGIIVSYETIRLWCQKFGAD
jgi:hypothetical protein